MAEQSLITYQELENAANQYQQRSEEIRDLENALRSLNDNLSSSWQNDTANSFFERYQSEYGPGLQKTAEALESISTFITNYANKQQELDQEISNSIRSGA